MKPNDIAVNSAQIEKKTAIAPIGKEQLADLTRILEKYKAGKKHTDSRIISSENWWKIRNSMEESKDTDITKEPTFTSQSAWLHNVIVTKHADAVLAYPEANLLPREESDSSEAKVLSSIIPCVLEQCKFEHTYDEAMWRKVKSGTAVYKVIWDKNKLNGLGDISIECVNLLNLYWEPGITDIQKSKYIFYTSLMDKDDLEERYPQLDGKLKGTSLVSSKFVYDDTVSDENKATIIEVYYHKYINGKNTLQYVKYVGDTLLYATENEREPIDVDKITGNPMPSMAEAGLYDHGKYPFVFDALYPIEGSPCGYGYVDVCRNPQTAIDILNTSFLKNALVGAIPRYFARGDGTVNEKEFLDLTKPIVHIPNGVDEVNLRRIEHNSLDGNYMGLLDRMVQELRETAGNTGTSTGSSNSQVTAASAIAALQEAEGKGSKASIQASYRAFSNIVEICIELIRQFYNEPRKFRIVGQYGAEQYISYTNTGLQPIGQGNAFGVNDGVRLPVFDIRVSAQKANTYTKLSQNELALQFFKMGFFSPQMTEQALMCLSLMDFDGKDEVQQKVAQNGTIYQKLVQYMQIAFSFAQTENPTLAEQIGQEFKSITGGNVHNLGGAMPNITVGNNLTGGITKEHAFVENARERAASAAQPDGGRVISGGAND